MFVCQGACVCVSVCLSCSCSDFWKPWPRNFVFGMPVHLQNVYVKLICQGHEVKFKVTGAKNGYKNVTKYRHLRVVCLWLKGKLFIGSFYPNVTTLRSGLCYRKSACRLSVTLVHPTQWVEAFGNISSPLCTLAILWPPCKIVRK